MVRIPEPKQYSVAIRDRKFIPSYLKVKKNSIVKWTVVRDIERDDSMYGYDRTKSHVIIFD